VTTAAKSGGRAPLSVIVTTFNEEHNIAPCLESVRWAEEILVVDSGSTDGTIEAVRPFATRILRHPYESAARQKNWAIPQAHHPWVLILDADERVTAELAAEIRDLLRKGPPRLGYWIYRRNSFLGREIRYGGWGSDRVIRFFARDHARYPDLLVHAEMDVDGPVGVLKGRLLHHSVRSLASYSERMDRYSNWWAEGRHRSGRRASALSVFLHTGHRFLRMYLLKGGFLDGGHGLVLSLMASFSVFQKHAKLWERDRTEPEPE
jgi:glycosyltransferase involved in cell wall biosynthesis